MESGHGSEAQHAVWLSGAIPSGGAISSTVDALHRLPVVMAVMTVYFPCVTSGRLLRFWTRGKPVAFWAVSCMVCSYQFSPAPSWDRQKLRIKHNLVQAPVEDWSVHLFCPCCALCQKFRGSQNRGIDSSIGWIGYFAQQQKAKMVPPVVHSLNK